MKFLVSMVMWLLILGPLAVLFQEVDESGWKAFVPVLNVYTMADIANVNKWSVLLSLIPVVNIAYMFYLTYVFLNYYGNYTKTESALVTIFPYIALPYIALKR